MAGTIITIARQMGSGGDAIGAELARALSIPLLDHQILEAAAAVAGASPDDVREGERVPGRMTQMLEYIARSGGYAGESALVEMEREAWNTGEKPFRQALTRADYRGLIERVLRQTAQESDAVIIGHGGAIVLAGNPNVFKVLVCSPLELRIGRLQASEGLTYGAARDRIRTDDRERAEYFRTYYKLNWLEAGHYDLTVNTGHINPASAVGVVLSVHARFAPSGQARLTVATP